MTAWEMGFAQQTGICIGAVGSARFANKVSERKLNLTAGTVLILVSVVSWILSK